MQKYLGAGGERAGEKLGKVGDKGLAGSKRQNQQNDKKAVPTSARKE